MLQVILFTPEQGWSERSKKSNWQNKLSFHEKWTDADTMGWFIGL